MKGKVKISKKNLLITLVVVLALVAITGFVIAFVANYNDYIPQAPTILEDGKNVFISSQSNDNYQSYKFKFHKQNEDIILESKTNVISSDQAIEKGCVLGQTYQVSVSFISEKESNNTLYSKSVKWMCAKYLDSPKPQYDVDLSQLQWSDVQNADYYRVYFNGQSDYIETNDNFVTLEGQAGGVKDVSVVAFSNSAGYKPSVSERLTFEYVRLLKGFSELSFDSVTKEFTCYSEEQHEAVIIVLDAREYTLKTFDVVKTGEKYKYTIDLSSYYDQESQIGIIPKSIDKYNKNDGNIVYFQVEFNQ